MIFQQQSERMLDLFQRRYAHSLIVSFLKGNTIEQVIYCITFSFHEVSYLSTDILTGLGWSWIDGTAAIWGGPVQ